MRERRRLVRRIVGLAVALAVIGPGRPIVLTAMNDQTEGSRATLADHARVEATEGPGSWTVDIDLLDETSQPRDGETTLPASSSSKRHALIVGIDNAVGGKPLPGSVTDAKNVREALLMYGFREKNITVLLEGKATRAGIRDGLERLAQRTPSNGTAVFAIATHSRRRGGQSELLTADGLRISASELAAALGKVRGRMWTALPTCYSGGYAKPGIVGKDRIATFASSADEPAYQVGGAGSFLIMTMVAEGMLEHRAPGSVEDAFAYAKRELEAKHPNHVPEISDGVAGDLLLGRAPESRTAAVQARAIPHEWRSESTRYRRSTARSTRPAAEYEPAPDPPESADEEHERGDGGIGICGTYQARC